MIKVGTLKKNPSNPRQIKGEKLALLKQSIIDFEKMMVLRPMIVDESGVVLGGNMRLAAIKALGMKEVPDDWVKRVDDLTPDEKREFIIKDNNSFGEYDWDILANEWSDLPLTAWGLDMPDFEAVDEPGTADAEPQIDKAAELNEKWKVVSGDLWQIGSHRLVCGDSCSPQDVLRVLDGAKPQMVFADPPYGIEIIQGAADGGSKPFGSIGGDNIIQAGVYSPVIGDDTTETAIDAYVLASELFPKAIQIWWGGNHYANALPASSGWLVWDKDNTGNFGDGELAWTNQPTALRIFKHTWNGLIKESERGEKRVHPTQKPVELAVWCFNKYGDECDVIFDPFCGSGMSIVAGQNTNKQVRASEMSPDYCAVILERMATAFPNLEIKRIEHAEAAKT